MQTLCNLVLQMGTDFNVFVPMLGKVLSKFGITHPTYDTLVARLMKNQPLVPEGETPEATPPKHPEPAADDAAIS
jgi:FKBP12-rapamycin complex-associated protein